MWRALPSHWRNTTRASLVTQTVKNLPAMQETQVQSLGREDPLEKGMATHSSILAWRSLWTEEPGGLQSMGSQRIRYNWATNTFTLSKSLEKYHKVLSFSFSVPLPGLCKFSSFRFSPSAKRNRHNADLGVMERLTWTAIEIYWYNHVYFGNCLPYKGDFMVPRW